MGEFDGHPARPPPETLQGGPSRPSWLDAIPSSWRPRALVVLAFLVGVAVGGGALFWWQGRPVPPSTAERPDPLSLLDEHAVELVLFRATSSPPAGAGSTPAPLRVGGAVILSGVVTSTVSRIESTSLEIRAAALPVTVSPSTRFQVIELEITVQDCPAAARWRPTDRPLLIVWRDEYGKEHLDRAGDFNRSASRSVVRYIAAVCRPD